MTSGHVVPNGATSELSASVPTPQEPPLAIPGIPLDRPELHVGAAFAGGLLLAMVLKRLAR